MKISMEGQILCYVVHFYGEAASEEEQRIIETFMQLTDW